MDRNNNNNNNNNNKKNTLLHWMGPKSIIENNYCCFSKLNSYASAVSIIKKLDA